MSSTLHTMRRFGLLSLLTGSALAGCGSEPAAAVEKLELASRSQAVTEEERTPTTPEGAYSDFLAAGATGSQVTQALGVSGAATASFGSSDPNGFSVFSSAASGFPSEGNSYLVISSGCTSVALSPNNSSSTTCSLGGLNNPAGQDMVQVTTDLTVPTGAKCWLVDWKFFSEEFPEFVNSSFNDAFLIEVGSSNINISGTTITAPNNVAYDANGKLISINTTGALGMSLANAAGTTYDGATAKLTTQAPIPAGASSLRLIFSVMDIGDSSYDSTAFIDNVRFSGSPCGDPVTTPTNPNTPPSLTVEASSVTVPEGSVASISGTYADANTGDTVALTASIGTLTKTGTSGGSWTWSLGTNDGPAQGQTVTVTATDGKGGSASTSFVLNVQNVAPQAFINAPDSGSEGQAVYLTGSSSDPSSADAAAGIALSWLVTKDGNPYASGAGASFSFTPDDNGSYDIVLTAQDKDGGAGSATSALQVANIAPSATLTSSASTINEGESIVVNLTDAFDVSAADTAAGLRYAFACDGVSLGKASYEAAGTSASAVCPFADNGTYTISARILDKDDGSTDYVTTVVVNNVAPTITSVVSPSGPLELGSAALFSATFTDPGVLDTHTCSFSWDDGTSHTVMASSSGGSGSCTTAHTYAAPGVYSVQVMVMDKDGGVAFAHSEYVVVYDPNGGFVTGGGWILSPAGAYAAEPAATGKASFGFVSKYQKGASSPTGQTEFQFKAGNLNFHSTAYEWLVVAGARAQYKGTGKINNAGEYGFLLTAVDGQVSGGNAADQFRIKIWNKDSGVTVYDNRLGASDDLDAADPQVIGGGSIVIHK